jgi:S-adenosylhomocysteine hydrolase
MDLRLLAIVTAEGRVINLALANGAESQSPPGSLLQAK